MERIYDVIVLFSGGLDSLLTAKILEKQGLRVKCLHFVSSFFGSMGKIDAWKKEYGLDVEAVNVSEEYNTMLYNPAHGYGKTLNPCIDCKILLLSNAYHYMKKYNAVCVATGEVLGQRPMSQRKDALNLIERGSHLEGYLLRPLTAKNLPPTKAERDGIVDREQLYAFHGRGRNNQLALAKEFGITTIPSPAGGCSLTTAETAQSFYPILEHVRNASTEDYALARAGKQYWKGLQWLILGRNAQDTDKLIHYAKEEDYRIYFKEYKGTMALVRNYAKNIVWEDSLWTSVAYMMQQVSPKVQLQEGDSLTVIVAHAGEEREYTITFSSSTKEKLCVEWKQPVWNEIKTKAHKKEHVIIE